MSSSSSTSYRDICCRERHSHTHMVALDEGCCTYTASCPQEAKRTSREITALLLMFASTQADREK